MLGNYFYHKEIGYYINESIPDKYSQSDLNEIISKTKIIFENIDNNNLKVNTKYKETSKNFIIFYILINSDTFYLSAVTKDFESQFREEEIFELFSDIESQKIKKLTDKNGELSKIGKQNLKFCIEQSYQRINKESNSLLNFFNNKSDNNDNLSNISLLSTHINESQNDGKEERKTFLENEKGIENEKNEKTDKLKIELNDDELVLQKKIKCRKRTGWICLILTIIIISTMVIVFFYK
jgi:hypothetical protein